MKTKSRTKKAADARPQAHVQNMPEIPVIAKPLPTKPKTKHTK